MHIKKLELRELQEEKNLKDGKEYELKKGTELKSLRSAIENVDSKIYAEILANSIGQAALNQIMITLNVANYGTDQYVGSEACHTSLTYAGAWYTKLIAPEKKEELLSIINQSLEKRPLFYSEDKSHSFALLQHAYQFYSFHQRPGQENYNLNLIRYVTVAVTAQDFSTFVESKEADPFCRFLILRISSLMKIGCEITCASHQPLLAPLTISKEIFSKYLHQEILVNLEMLRMWQDIRILQLINDESRTRAIPILAKRLITTLVALPNGQEYVLTAGWKAADKSTWTIYLNWLRQGDDIIWRIDNLNSPINAKRKFIPALIGQCRVSALEKKTYQNYFIELIQNLYNLPSREVGLDFFYQKLGELPKMKLPANNHSLWESLTLCFIRNEELSYVKNLELGFYLRLKKNTKLMEYFLDSYTNFMRQLQNFHLEEGFFFLRNFRQLENCQQQPDYFSNKLHRYYQELSHILLDDKQKMPITEAFFNLSDEESLLTHRELLTSSLEDVCSDEISSKVNIHTIWQIPDQPRRRHLVLIARSGMGKSIFCQYIAHQWSQHHHGSEVSGIFWLRLGDLKRYEKLVDRELDLIDIIQSHCLPQTVFLYPTQRQILQKKIDQNQVLWLLDGYHEITEILSAHPKRSLARLIDKLLQQSSVLLTSQPQALSYIRQQLPEATLISMCGFSDNNIRQYITKCLPNPSQVNKLITFLEQQAIIWNVARIPIILKLICSLWNQGKLSGKVINLTNFYQQLSLGLLNDDKPDAEKLSLLAKLAFFSIYELTVAPYQQLDHKACQQYAEERLKLNKIFSNYRFTHQTFWEFHAARHIAQAYSANPDSQPHQQMLDFTAQNKHNPHLEVTWWFVAGILGSEYKDHPDYLHRFLKQLLREPRAVVPSAEWGLLLRCIDEAGIPKTSNLLSAIQQYNQSMINHHINTGSDLYFNWWRLLNHSPRVVNGVNLLEMGWKMLSNPKNLSSQNKLLLFLANIYLTSMTKLNEKQINHLLKMLEADIHENLRMSVFEVLCYRFFAQLSSNIKIQILKELSNILKLSNHHFMKPFALNTLFNMLGRLSTNWQKRIVKDFLSLLEDKNNFFRPELIAKLEKEIPTLPEHLQLLVIDRLFKMQDFDLLSLVIQYLSNNSQENFGKALLDRVADEKYIVRKEAIILLGRIINPSPDLQALICQTLLLLMDDENDEVRATAVSVITDKMPLPENLRERATKILLRLKKEDKNSKVRADAMVALSLMVFPRDLQEHVDQDLFDALKNKEFVMRCAAIKALGKRVEHLPEALQAQGVKGLLNALEDEILEVRYAALMILAQVRGLSTSLQRQADKGFLTMLEDKHDSLRHAAIVVLGEKIAHLPEDLQANGIIALFKALKDMNSRIRFMAVKTLNHPILKLRFQKSAANGLLNLLMDSDYEVRLVVAETLQLGWIDWLPNLRKSVAVELIKVLRNPLLEGEWRKKVIGVLDQGMAYFPAELQMDVVKSLIRELDDKHDEVRQAVIQMLERSQVRLSEDLQKTVITHLFKAMGKNELFQSAIYCLKKIMIQHLSEAGEKAYPQISHWLQNAINILSQKQKTHELNKLISDFSIQQILYLYPHFLTIAVKMMSGYIYERLFRESASLIIEDNKLILYCDQSKYVLEFKKEIIKRLQDDLQNCYAKSIGVSFPVIESRYRLTSIKPKIQGGIKADSQIFPNPSL